MGRNYEYSEWLQFECEGVKLSKEIAKLAEKFAERANEVADEFLFSLYGPSKSDERGVVMAYNEDALVWNTYASIVGHGVGLWEEDGDTGLPGELEGKLDAIVKKDKKLQKLASQIDMECHALKDAAGVEEKHAADFPSKDAAVRGAQSHGATHVVLRPTHVFAFNPRADGYEKRELFFARGKLHWPSASVHVKTLPVDAIPIEHALGRQAAETPRGEGPLQANAEMIGSGFTDAPEAIRYVWRELSAGTDTGVDRVDAKTYDVYVENEYGKLVSHRVFQTRDGSWAIDARTMFRQDFPPRSPSIGDWLRKHSGTRAREEARRQRVRFRFEDEKEWQTSDFDSFISHNRNALDDLDIQNIRNGKRVTLGGGASPVVFVELIRGPHAREDAPQGREPLEAGAPRYRGPMPQGDREPLKTWDVVYTLDEGKTFQRVTLRARSATDARQRARGIHGIRDSQITGVQGPFDFEETPQGGEPLQMYPKQEWVVTTLWINPDENAIFERKHERAAIDGWGAVEMEITHNEERLATSMKAEGWHYRIMGYDAVRGMDRVRLLKPATEKQLKQLYGTPKQAMKLKGIQPVADAPRVGQPLQAGEAREATPSSSEDAVPWVRITRDPEQYAEGMKRAKEIGPLDSGRQVYELLGPALSRENQEVFLVVLCNLRSECLGVAEVHRGERSRVSVSRADILQVVTKSGADHFMVVHNHPSGDPTPSDADRKLTKAIMSGADNVDVPCVDHVVIGMGKYYSFSQNKTLKV